MPFTFAHPAIILPLAKTKWKLSLTGLIAGSVVPDFEFFIRLQLAENIGHHWQGIFIFDLPVALVLCFAYQNIVRDTFINHLPCWCRSRLQIFKNFCWNKFAFDNKLILVLSVLIGVCSHLLWDALTHYDGAFVTALPILSKNLPVAEFSIPMYDVLQLMSSIGGLWFVYRYVAALPAQKITKPQLGNYLIYWSSWMILSGFILCIRLLVVSNYQSFWDTVFAGIGSLLYAWLIASLAHHKLTRISRREPWR
jgi:Domain of unknown function (DUF4184)